MFLTRRASRRTRNWRRGSSSRAAVSIGKHLGMFDERRQNSNVIYAISDEPMSAEEWKKQFAKEG